jgi:hypothetical protein
LVVFTLQGAFGWGTWLVGGVSKIGGAVRCVGLVDLVMGLDDWDQTDGWAQMLVDEKVYLWTALLYFFWDGIYGVKLLAVRARVLVHRVVRQSVRGTKVQLWRL